MQDPHFWDQPQQAEKVIEEVNAIKSWTHPFEEVESCLNMVKEFSSELQAGKDEVLVQELYQELDKAGKIMEELEIKKMLSGELDNKNCYLTINAGAGGTEACDWAQMLARMYQRWAHKRKWKVEVVDSLPGDVAGVKSMTLSLQGPFAYGYAKAEK
ncbi:MAG: PCRF domain-containing protein, partial [Chlamydiae bacterium]|nr:PCRF domain-containing protein [Chlamydiota bacterium]